MAHCEKRSRLALAARARGSRGCGESAVSQSANLELEPELPRSTTSIRPHVLARCSGMCERVCDLVVIATSSRDRETRVASALERGRAARQRTGVQCQCAVGPWEARAREKYFYNNIHRAQGAAAGVGARHSAAPLGTGRAQRATEPQCIKPVPRGRLALLGAVQTSSSNDALLPNFVPDDVDDDSDLSGMRNPTAIGAMPPISLSLSLSLSLLSLPRLSHSCAHADPPIHIIQMYQHPSRAPMAWPPDTVPLTVSCRMKLEPHLAARSRIRRAKPCLSSPPPPRCLAFESIL